MEGLTKEKLDFILKEHALWLETRYLSNETLGQRASFYNMNLRGINLKGADLRDADFRNANLERAKLDEANLERANLEGANLRGASLVKANLEKVDLLEANLNFANLEGANLDYANLSNSNLSSADLCGASLKKTDFTSANLYSTILDEKEKVRQGMVLKEDLVGYKIALELYTRRYCIIKLLIPKGAIVFSINNYKCRTNRCKVVAMYDLFNNDKIRHKACSTYNHDFIYEEEQEIEIDNFDCQYNVECSIGIHFFRTKEEAENYG